MVSSPKVSWNFFSQCMILLCAVYVRRGSRDCLLSLKVQVKSLSHVRLFATPWTVACTRLLCPWDFPGKNTGVDCHFLLHRIFLTQGSNCGLRDWTQVFSLTGRHFTLWATGKLLHFWVEIKKKKKKKKSLWYIYWLLESFLLTSNALGYISLQNWISVQVYTDPKNDFFSDTELHLVKAW